MDNSIHNYSKETVDRSTLHGSFGKAHETNEKATKTLLDSVFGEKKFSDTFSIAGDSRMDRWGHAIKGFAKLGACTGALISEAVLVPADVITGQGKKDNESNFDPRDKGIAGVLVRGGTELAAVVGMGAGGVTGFGTGLLTEASRHGTEKDLYDHMNDNVNDGATVVGKAAASTVGGIGGVALDIVRAPSIIIKTTARTVGGLLYGAVGFVVGGYRAITNDLFIKKD